MELAARGSLLLAFGGALIFPVTQLVLRLMGRRASLGPDNPMGRLAMQVAFTIPLNLIVVGGATLHRVNWFYPGCMIVVGSHYLPFVHLYGMWQYAVLGALLVAGGVAIGASASWNSSTESTVLIPPNAGRAVKPSSRSFFPPSRSIR